MILFLQSLSLKVRFAVLLVLTFPVLLFEWLLTQAPWALAQLQVLSAGAGLPDTRFWYSVRDFQGWMTAWGDPGRDLYWKILWPTDTGFLLSYGALLCAAMLYLLKKRNPRNPWWYLLALVPVATAGFDFLENGLTVLNSFVVPEGIDALVTVEAACTSGKWVGLGLSAALLLGGTVVHLVLSALAHYRRSRGLDVRPLDPEEPGLN